jgi:hypothetical protein
MVMADMIAHVVDVKGAFLHGEFDDGKKIHMKIPKGVRKIFPGGECLITVIMPVWTQASCEIIL